MRSILAFALLTLGGVSAWATEIDAPAEMSIFPLYMSGARFEEFQSGNHMRRADVYRLVSDEYEAKLRV